MITVRIRWRRDQDNISLWNEILSWAETYFGPLGERFKITANVNYADFIFYDKNDALMACLRWNGQIVTDDELAVETVSRFLS